MVIKFKQFKPRTFEWRNPSMHKNEETTGFIAQELESLDSWLSYEIEGKVDKPYADTEVYKEGDKPMTKKKGAKSDDDFLLDLLKKKNEAESKTKI